jgi:uncharacterized protein YndB with AHSA1/START domain
MPFTKEVHHTLHIKAPKAKVWNALTQPGLMKLWLWETEVEVISDWKPGSDMVFNGAFHDMPYSDKGVILKLEKEAVFSYSYWSHLSQLPDSPENYQVVEFKLVRGNEGTKLSLVCGNLINEAIYGHWNFYWIVTLDLLKKVIETTDPV